MEKKSRLEISIYLNLALPCRHEAAVQRRCCVLVRRDARLAHARRRTDDLRPVRRARLLLPCGQRPCGFSPSGDAGAALSSGGGAAGTRQAMVRRGSRARHRLSHPASRGARTRRTSGTRGSGRPSHVLPARPGQAALGDVVHRRPGAWTCRDSDEDASRPCRRCVGRRFERNHARHQPATASPAVEGGPLSRRGIPPFELRALGGVFNVVVRTPYRLLRIAQQTLSQQLAVRGLADKPPRFFEAPTTRFNAEISTQRRISSSGVPLDRVKAIKRAFGVKLNDVVLALVSGAIRRYLLDRGSSPIDRWSPRFRSQPMERVEKSVTRSAR